MTGSCSHETDCVRPPPGPPAEARLEKHGINDHVMLTIIPQTYNFKLTNLGPGPFGTLPCSSRSTSAVVTGRPVPPSAVVDRPPTTLPQRRHSASGRSSNHAFRKPALKQSPAPVVSTEATEIPGACNVCPPVRAYEPLAPSLTITRGHSAASAAIASPRSALPAIRRASAALGRKASTLWRLLRTAGFASVTSSPELPSINTFIRLARTSALPAWCRLP